MTQTVLKELLQLESYLDMISQRLKSFLNQRKLMDLQIHSLFTHSFDLPVKLDPEVFLDKRASLDPKAQPSLYPPPLPSLKHQNIDSTSKYNQKKARLCRKLRNWKPSKNLPQSLAKPRISAKVKLSKDTVFHRIPKMRKFSHVWSWNSRFLAITILLLGNIQANLTALRKRNKNSSEIMKVWLNLPRGNRII